MVKVGCKVFAIPLRSPDINPIENIFHLVSKELKENALRDGIEYESYKQGLCREMHNNIKKTFRKTLLTRQLTQWIKE